MKWFWYSLIGFCLMMCSCRTKKVDSNVKARNDVRSELAYLNNTVKIDTSKTAYFAEETKNIVIEEDITVIEYDKESGKPIKETKTKRQVTQDSDKMVAEEETQGVTKASNDSLFLVANVGGMMESKTETVTESSGMNISTIVLGLTIGFIIGLFIVYLLNKLRVN